MFLPIESKVKRSLDNTKNSEDKCEDDEDKEEENDDEEDEINEDEESQQDNDDNDIDEAEEEEDDDEEDGGMSVQELIELRKKMSTLPLAKLSELKAQLGSNLFNKALYGESSSALNAKTIQSSSNQRNIAKIATTKNAKRPREESSKRPSPKLRCIKGVMDKLKKTKNSRWDPRFSAESGEFDEVAFHRDYAFLDDLRQRDIRELQKALKKAKREQNVTAAERIRLNLRRLQNQQKSADDQRLIEEIQSELRQSNIERMNRGQPAIYLNNYELKQRLLDRKREIGNETSGMEEKRHKGKAE